MMTLDRSSTSTPVARSRLWCWVGVRSWSTITTSARFDGAAIVLASVSPASGTSGSSDSSAISASAEASASASRRLRRATTLSNTGTSPLPPVQVDSSRRLPSPSTTPGASRARRWMTRPIGSRPSVLASRRSSSAIEDCSSPSVMPGSCTATTTAGGRSPLVVRSKIPPSIAMGPGPYSILISSANAASNSPNFRGASAWSMCPAPLMISSRARGRATARASSVGRK